MSYLCVIPMTHTNIDYVINCTCQVKKSQHLRVPLNVYPLSVPFTFIMEDYSEQNDISNQSSTDKINFHNTIVRGRCIDVQTMCLEYIVYKSVDKCMTNQGLESRKNSWINLYNPR